MEDTITLINGDIISKTELQYMSKANQSHTSLIYALNYWKTIHRGIVRELSWQLNTDYFYEIRYLKFEEKHTKFHTIYFSNEEERDAYYKHLKTL